MSSNYPRDQFDRVPEYNTRVGAHHAHGWAQSAAIMPTGGKLRWVVIVAVLTLIVGAFAFMVSPQRSGDAVAGGETNSTQSTESAQPTESAESAQPTEASESAQPTESETPSPSSTIDEADVLYGQQVGVYNAANIGGIAGAGQSALADAGFSSVVTNNWTRPAATSTVYYASEAYRATAEKVAEALQIDQVLQTANIPNRVTAVMGADDTLGVQ